MASCITSQWVSYSPQVKLIVELSSSTETSETYNWTLQYISTYAASSSAAKKYSVVIDGATAKSGTYVVGGKTGTNTIATGTKTFTKGTSAVSKTFSVSFSFELTWSGVYCGTKSASGSFTVAKKAAYTITYNANGGTGAPGAQSKSHGVNLTISNTKPTRTGYSFLGWSTSSTATSATWTAGGTYSTNASATLYAVWKANTYTVSYNANGGTGAPGAQTKTYGQTLVLSSVKPTRTNYNFLGWGTSSTASSVSYASGSNYTANSGITLYAVWALGYINPRITNLNIFRCYSDGTANDSGTRIHVKFNWACDRTVSKIEILYKKQAVTAWTTYAVSASGSSGSVDEIILRDIGPIELDSTYDVKVIVTDSISNSYIERTVSGQKYAVDFLAGGTGVAFGKPAEKANTMEVNYTAEFNNTVNIKGNRYTFYPGYANGGSAGYIRIARITIIGTQADSVISFVVYRRGGDLPITLHIRFSDGSDPNVAKFIYEGSICNAYAIKNGAGIWDIYVEKASGWDAMTVSDCLIPIQLNSHVKIEYPGGSITTISGTTNVKARSFLLDAVYPVNSIYISYSHTSPASLFGGTWVRIEHRFLLGAYSSDSIGSTGGEWNHVLTTAEMPSHGHTATNGGRIYQTRGSGTSEINGLTVGSAFNENTGAGGVTRASATGTNGGGSSHNNMPPYVYVSIWRRTA